MTNPEINFRQSNPIEYVLKCLLEDADIQKFDVCNAIDQWNHIKKQLQLLDIQ